MPTGRCVWNFILSDEIECEGYHAVAFKVPPMLDAIDIEVERTLLSFTDQRTGGGPFDAALLYTYPSFTPLYHIYPWCTWQLLTERCKVSPPHVWWVRR